MPGVKPATHWVQAHRLTRLQQQYRFHTTSWRGIQKRTSIETSEKSSLESTEPGKLWWFATQTPQRCIAGRGSRRRVYVVIVNWLKLFQANLRLPPPPQRGSASGVGLIYRSVKSDQECFAPQVEMHPLLSRDLKCDHKSGVFYDCCLLQVHLAFRPTHWHVWTTLGQEASSFCQVINFSNMQI